MIDDAVSTGPSTGIRVLWQHVITIVSHLFIYRHCLSCNKRTGREVMRFDGSTRHGKRNSGRRAARIWRRRREGRVGDRQEMLAVGTFTALNEALGSKRPTSVW